MLCPTCSSEMKMIPAGISRTTQKPYNAFWACPNKCPKPKSDYQKSVDAVKDKIPNAPVKLDTATLMKCACQIVSAKMNLDEQAHLNPVSAVEKIMKELKAMGEKF